MSRAWRVLGLSLVGAALVWKLVAELIEPHFLLLLKPRAQVVEAETIGGTRLRLYSDPRPFTGKIAGLQKGLVWVRNGRELVGEGYGFGCPIVESDGRSFLSRHARTEIASVGAATRLTKHYEIDTVDTPLRFLRRKYRAVPSLGTVTFRYDVWPDGTVDVEVDFSALDTSWSKAYLMNEQGARHFVRYRDVLGARVDASELGIWHRSDGPLAQACFDSEEGHLGFCVELETPSQVYYGRERYNQYNWRGIYYLSWSGIDIEVPGPRDSYRYRVTLEDR